MTHADPWDEMARLQEQMEAELLAQPEAPPLVVPQPVEAGKFTEPLAKARK